MPAGEGAGGARSLLFDGRAGVPVAGQHVLLLEQGQSVGCRGDLDEQLERLVRFRNDRFQQSKGSPQAVRSSAQSYDVTLQRRLWSLSEELTGITFQW
ncbi:hypothetical protein ACIPC1_12250 [Streptomyces sp. NPDC087263]|uniref:hypothetical protein n=1 Tax=Streptomyces sp. NPDC087263 TaxID=3365773 RepID=UPI0038067CB0